MRLNTLTNSTKHIILNLDIQIILNHMHFFAFENAENTFAPFIDKSKNATTFKIKLIFPKQPNSAHIYLQIKYKDYLLYRF